MLKIGILASTNGTDLPYLFDGGIEGVSFECLISNKKECGAMQKASSRGVLTYFISAKGKSREEFDQEAVNILKEKNVDLVLLVGFMRIISPIFVQAFKNKILNVHPSLLPSFAGGMDSNVHEDVLSKGCKVSGATVHFVSEEVDEGAILLQEVTKIKNNDTADTLKARVQKLEQEMLKSAIIAFRDDKVYFENNIAKIKNDN
ncbi:MAG: phosphoribosylglycinamide formyltransferase [Candidatus Gracilibacteria bacterium]|jgi:phosphoribosylglycinamide formyltransferase-1|nr:phosphoribosylglycinamide formyltransferase [Candidatus Gracilibacteria bacterium]